MMPDFNGHARAAFRAIYDRESAGEYLFSEAWQLLDSRLGCPTNIHGPGVYVKFIGLSNEGQLSVDGFKVGTPGREEDMVEITCSAFRLRWNKQRRAGRIEVPREAEWRDATREELKACADTLRMLRPLELELSPKGERNSFGELVFPGKPSAPREDELDKAVQGHLDKLFREINPDYPC